MKEFKHSNIRSCCIQAFKHSSIRSCCFGCAFKYRITISNSNSDGDGDSDSGSDSDSDSDSACIGVRLSSSCMKELKQYSGPVQFI